MSGYNGEGGGFFGARNIVVLILEYYLGVANDSWISWEELIPRYNFLHNIKYQIHGGMKIAKTDKQLNIMLALTEYLGIKLPLLQINSCMVPPLA